MFSPATVTSQHVSNLRLELERCYCSGAWIACIILSAAVVEIHLSNLGGWKESKAQDLLDKLGVVEEADQLKDRRNHLIHGEVGLDGRRVSRQRSMSKNDPIWRKRRDLLCNWR